MHLPRQSKETGQEVSPRNPAALIDSLFEAPGPLLAGIIFVVIAAAMTALKTEQVLTWICVGLLMTSGAVRLLDLKRFLSRKSCMTAEEAEQCQRRYRIGAMFQAAAIGIWCSTTLLSNDDAVVHMICLSVTTGIVAGGALRAYGRPEIFHQQALLQFGPAG